MEIRKIVLTGGPCGGKSTGLEYIRREYEKKGWRVLAVDECATEVIKSGIAPGKSNTNFDFELPIVQLQKAKEEIFEQAARQLPDEKVLIIYDRGFLDMKTYCSDLEFEQICQAVKMSEEEMKHRYDGIFTSPPLPKAQKSTIRLPTMRPDIRILRRPEKQMMPFWKCGKDIPLSG